jgi:hypothetical protein
MSQTAFSFSGRLVNSIYWSAPRGFNRIQSCKGPETGRRIRVSHFSTTTDNTKISGRKLRRPSQGREGVGLPKGALYERYKLIQETKSGLPKDLNNFIVLGIESSCDDTGVAVVTSTGKILSNVVYSQHKVHQNFGGVVPSLAMEAHRANIDIAIEKAIADAGLKSVADVDAIAVTKGPGLEICLRIGCRKAQVCKT